MTNTTRASGLAALLGAIATAGVLGFAVASAAQPDQTGFERMGRAMVEGLLATPGCLGVETAQTSSGKHVIFAWFEDKEAVLAWHESPAHQRAMNVFFPERAEGHEPMQHIPDGTGPILTIASLKPSERPPAGMRIPVSEMSIEMYTPLPGGLRFNGGFTPGAVPVDGVKQMTFPEAAPEEEAPAGY